MGQNREGYGAEESRKGGSKGRIRCCYSKGLVMNAINGKKHWRIS
jgi:hypothetical protein